MSDDIFSSISLGLGAASSIMAPISMAMGMFNNVDQTKRENAAQRMRLEMQGANKEFELGMKGIDAETDASNLEFTADMLEMDRGLIEREKQWQIFSGMSKALQLGRRAANLRSEQRTMFAHRGIDMDEGSAAEMQASTKHLAREEAITININTLRSVEDLHFKDQEMRGKILGLRQNARSVRGTGKFYTRMAPTQAKYIASSGSYANPWDSALGQIPGVLAASADATRTIGGIYDHMSKR